MEFINATRKHLDDIKNIYLFAVKHMNEENNYNQWQENNDIFIESIIKYIDNNCFYVAIENDEIVGFFAMIFGKDKTYEVIDGKWINDLPYVTIHRIASKYYQRHIASNILDFVIDKALINNIYNIRIDTHKDNISMQTFLNKKGFIKCGIISITCDFNDEKSLRYAYIKEL